MLNKLTEFIRRYDMLQPGDRVVCAVSGGADSVALLFAFYLLAEKLGVQVSAAHFNHHLRGAESDRDEDFVRELCSRFDIPLHLGGGEIIPGKKGLEAAAREARYAFLKTLPGKLATAHTADDNAETVLMHLVRGTGLKGLGGIMPVNGNLIRPMLGITRQEVEDFLAEYHLTYVTDSSNAGDAFLRNRLRHQVMPLLKQENPRLAENVSQMAMRLRADEQALAALSKDVTDVEALRKLQPALRARALAAFLESCGVKEPEAEHIALAEKLVFSDKPSARAYFPGGVVICRNYDRLEKLEEAQALSQIVLRCPGEVTLPSLGLRVTCREATALCSEKDRFTVAPRGQMVLRSRLPGDAMRRSGGTKQLKKLFIDHKIPSAARKTLPVIADDAGVLGVFGFGANIDRLAETLPAVEIIFTSL